jgi:hypothetical protein
MLRQAIALLASGVLLLSRFPPEGSRLAETSDMPEQEFDNEGAEQDNGPQDGVRA